MKKKMLFSFHNVFSGRKKPIWEMATDKSTTKTEQKPYQTPSQASLLNIYKLKLYSYSGKRR